MTQSNLERSVARATGESLERIRRMGFSLVTPPAISRSNRQRTHIEGHVSRPHSAATTEPSTRKS